MIFESVAALAAEPDAHPAWWTRFYWPLESPLEYGFTDVDEKSPRPLTLADV